MIFSSLSLKARMTFFTLIIFLISIWSLAFYARHILQKEMEGLLGGQQETAVSMLAAQVNHDLDDRLKALESVAGRVSPAMLADPATLQTFLEQRPILQGMFNGGIVVVGIDGTVIADVPVSAGRIGVNYMEEVVIAAALKEGKASVGRPVIGKKLLVPVFGMGMPIGDAEGRVIGALSGVTNLGKANFLDKVSDNRYGKTGGYVLLVPQHRLVITATDKSRIMQALPAPGILPPFDNFLQGYEGSTVYTNPLGVEVLGSAKGIPVADWLLGVTLPTAEAFAPIRAMQQRILLAATLATLLVGVLTWWMLKSLLFPLLTTTKALAALATTDQLPQPLPIIRQDEIGELIGGFNHLLESLAERQEAVEASGKRYQTIIQAAMDGFWVVDTKGCLLEVNATYCTMSGYSRQELLAMHISHLEAAEDAGDIAAHIEKIMAQGEDRFESRHRRKDGRIFDVEISVQFQAIEGERFVVFLHDITERKLTEEALQLKNLVFHASLAANSVADPDGVITEANDAFLWIWGYASRDEVVGKHIQHFLNDQSEAVAIITALNETAGQWKGEYSGKRRDGTTFIAHGQATIVRDAKGKMIGYQSSVLDITERKLSEDALNSALAEKEMLLREVHHRVKNNLAAIMGLVDLQGQTMADASDKTAMTELSVRIKSMSLVHEQLYHSDNLARIDFQDYLETLISQLRLSYDHTGGVQISVAAAGVTMGLDNAVPCGLFITELIINAYKYAFPNGQPGPGASGCEIAVSASWDGATYTLAVADNGIGLPEDFNWKTAQTLGLTLVSMLGEHQLQGKVELDRSGGTVFRLRFEPKRQ